ncbi:MAG TPA: thiolase family protein [Anaerolineales bacterium]|nr:thiolase family protein [Anaerolineales bacterium]
MEDVFVVQSLRTPFGSFGGTLSDLDAPQLGATVLQSLLSQSKLDPAAVDEVILGQVLLGGAGQAPARQAMRRAGIPDSTHAMTVNKVCGSGLKAVMLAAGSIALGDSQVVLAGGMESMSRTPYALARARSGYRMGHGQLIDLLYYDGLQDPDSGKLMGEIADLAAERFELSRETQDEYAIRSYRRAQAAAREGFLRDEIVPVGKPGKKGDEVVAEDEEPFRADFEKMKKLRPAFRPEGTITAGNASSLADGAALVLLASGKAVKEHNLTPRARLAAYSTHSLAPERFSEAPVGAIRSVCERAGIRPGDVDLFEINEAFSSVVLIAMLELELDPERVNVNGGAVSLGHPIGASGGRLVTTLVRELDRRKVRYGLATLCIGGGEAVAALFERV